MANTQGFDSTETNYDAQIEWGYQKKTLSLSRKKSVPGSSGMDLPGEKKSREVLIEKAPGKFVDWNGKNWGTNARMSPQRLFAPCPIPGKRGQVSCCYQILLSFVLQLPVSPWQN